MEATTALLDSWSRDAVYHFLLTFGRIGTAFMMLPGFADSGVAQRTRLAGALGVTFAAFPLVAPGMPDVPQSAASLFVQLGAELVTGAFFGSLIRLIMGALHVGGATMAQNMLLSNVFGGGGTAFMGASTVSAIFMLGATTLIFVSGLHLHMIAALIESYEVIPAATYPDTDLFREMAERGGLKMFKLAAQLAGPFIAFGFLAKIAMGFINRANSKMPVFFVGLPLVVTGGLFLLAMTAPAVLQEFRAEFADWISMLRGF